MSPHAVALELTKLIAAALKHDDGSLRPCTGTTINPMWVAARAANIATAICGNYDVRPLAVAGEIEVPSVSCPCCESTSVYHVEDRKYFCVDCRAAFRGPERRFCGKCNAGYVYRTGDDFNGRRCECNPIDNNEGG